MLPIDSGLEAMQHAFQMANYGLPGLPQWRPLYRFDFYIADPVTPEFLGHLRVLWWISSQNNLVVLFVCLFSFLWLVRPCGIDESLLIPFSPPNIHEADPMAGQHDLET